MTAVAAILRYHQNRGELPAPNGSADPAGLNQFLTSYCPTDAKGVQTCDGFLVPLRRCGAGSESLARHRIYRRRGCGCGRGNSAGHCRFSGTRLASAAFACHVPERSARRRPLRGGYRHRRRWLHRDSGSEPALRAHQPDGLSERLQRRRRRLEGCSARRRTLRPAQSALHAVPGGGTLAACHAAPIPGHRHQFRGRTLRAALRSLRLGGFRRATPLRVRCSPVLRCATALSRHTRSRSAPGSPSTSNSPTSRPAGRSAISRVALPSLTRRLARSSTSRWHRRPSASRRRLSSMVPPSPRELPRAEWYPYLALASRGRGKLPRWTWTAPPCALLFATPFQINAEVPLTMAPGVHTIRVQSVYGSAQQAVTVSAVAPGIFLIGNPPVGAITNQNFNLVGTFEPPVKGTVAGYFRHRAGRGDTERATLQDECSSDRAVERDRAHDIFCRTGARLYRPISGERDGAGWYSSRIKYSPYPQSWGSAEQPVVVALQ